MVRWREYLTTLILAVFCALLVRNYVATAYKVPTGSMQPTLKPGDFIFASRLFWHSSASNPERGSLVVFSYVNQPSVTYVKRVIGLPGDRVQIIEGKLYINEQAVKYIPTPEAVLDNPNPDIFEVFEESFGEHKWRVILQRKSEAKNFGPIVVPPGEVFLLGDNRDASDDSRYWGTVPTSQIIGKVVLIWLSLDWQQKWGGDRYPSVRWQRVFAKPY